MELELCPEFCEKRLDELLGAAEHPRVKVEDGSTGHPMCKRARLIKEVLPEPQGPRTRTTTPSVASRVRTCSSAKERTTFERPSMSASAFLIGLSGLILSGGERRSLGPSRAASRRLRANHSWRDA